MHLGCTISLALCSDSRAAAANGESRVAAAEETISSLRVQLRAREQQVSENNKTGGNLPLASLSGCGCSVHEGYTVVFAAKYCDDTACGETPTRRRF